MPEFLFNKVAGQQNPSAQLLLNQMNIPTDVLYNEGVVMNSGKASLIVVRSIPRIRSTVLEGCNTSFSCNTYE